MSTQNATIPEGPTIFGHPTALFTLFFAEMWERFSYYGMRALLILYLMKGFFSLERSEAYTVYGAYVALVYMTPFIGGLIADRLLGPRRAVVLGGILMAAGHLVMGLEHEIPFFAALALLIVGNGFFKPNISAIVGDMYGDNDPRREGGFTLFYMGINLGAAMAPLLCGVVGELYGWHYGFGMATIGMLVGLAIFVVPSKIARFFVLAAAVGSGLLMVGVQTTWILYMVTGFVAIALFIAGGIAFAAMGKGGLAEDAGGAPNPELLKAPFIGPITREHLVYILSIMVVPLMALMVWTNLHYTIVPEEFLTQLAQDPSIYVNLMGSLLHEVARPVGLFLLVVGGIALAYLLVEAFKARKVERERLFVVIILMFFSMLFWAFFEQAGSSVNNFTDENVDRVVEASHITQDDVGNTVAFTVSQEQLGYTQGGEVFTINRLSDLRTRAQKRKDASKTADPTAVEWQIDESHVGMGIGGPEVPTSTFQSANPIFILIFGLPFAVLWRILAERRMEPNTAIKFALGLLQLGLGFLCLWYGASTATDRGMVWIVWLLLGYLLHTTGELCLSPVGLSMVTRLSPKRLVATTMGAWFLATAFSGYLAAVIATFTTAKKTDDGHGAAEAPADDGSADANADASADASKTAPDAKVAPPATSSAGAGLIADTDAQPVDTNTLTGDTDALTGDTDALTGDTDAPAGLAVLDSADTDSLTVDTDAPAGLAVLDSADTDAPAGLAVVDSADTDAPAGLAVVDAGDADAPADATPETAAPAATQATDVASLITLDAAGKVTETEEFQSYELMKPVDPPIDTVALYGDVFFTIAIASIISAVLLGALSPLLQKWMHQDKPANMEDA
ncbi:MAG: dipeptide/tripeptide permease [Kiritimatiellia bacterium]|jgi:dipeptide/tripeptide permease